MVPYPNFGTSWGQGGSYLGCELGGFSGIHGDDECNRFRVYPVWIMVAVVIIVWIMSWFSIQYSLKRLLLRNKTPYLDRQGLGGLFPRQHCVQNFGVLSDPVFFPVRGLSFPRFIP